MPEPGTLGICLLLKELAIIGGDWESECGCDPTTVTEGSDKGLEFRLISETPFINFSYKLGGAGGVDMLKAVVRGRYVCELWCRDACQWRGITVVMSSVLAGYDVSSYKLLKRAKE